MSKRAFILNVVAVTALFFAAVVLGTRAVRERIEDPLVASGAASDRLKPETVEFLKSLGGRVEFTAFRSSRDACPASMKPVVDRIDALLEKMREAAPETIDVRTIDPTVDAERGARHAGQKSAAPIFVKRVAADESSQVGVWASIVVTHDKKPDIVLQGIRPRDLDGLEDWIVTALKNSQSTRAPKIAVAAPAGKFSGMKSVLSKFTPDQNRGVPTIEVAEIDFDQKPEIPADADALFWVAPQKITAEHAAAVRAILDSGRAVVVAGAPIEIESYESLGALGHRVRRSSADWSALLAPFGLGAESLILLDKSHDGIATKLASGVEVKDDQPYHLRIAPSNFDTSRLTGPNTGALLIRSPAPITLDAEKLAREGRSAVVIATTAETGSAADLPDGAIDDVALSRPWPISKKPWIVLAAPEDPWKGDLIWISTSSLFDDGILAQGANANPLFLQTLARTFTSAQRLVRARVPRTTPATIDAPSSFTRIAWRLVIVFGIPLALSAVLLARAKRSGGKIEPAYVRIAAIGFGGVIVVGLAVRVLGGASALRFDLTPDKSNSPSPVAVRALAGKAKSVRAELAITDPSLMPAAWKGLERRVIETLALLDLKPTIVRPEDLSAEEKKKLALRGAEPFNVDVVDGDREKTVRVSSALILSADGKEAAIGRLDPAAAERLEFLAAAAVERLFGAPQKKIGVISDLPRLSPAEAGDYQQKGYTAPVGSDVYSEAKRLLADTGYEVAYINPEQAVFPEKMDALIWLQPRYAQRVLPLYAKYMAAGGKSLTALQHYNIVQRQYRGTGFKTVYWPRPQFHGFNDYLDLFGVRQIGEKRTKKNPDGQLGEVAGEVLFDRNHADLTLDTNIFRSAFTEHDRQQVARPFLVRVNGDGLRQDSPITAHLGNLLFIWPSRFSVDDERAKPFGLRATALATTSDRTWTYAWSGGYIPDESFDEPSEGLLGKSPLVLDLVGKFPDIEMKKDDNGRELPAAMPLAPDAREGRLTLVACSEMFKNGHLFRRDYANDKLLLNLVASLVYPTDMAELCAKTKTPRGLPYVPAATKGRWRMIVVGAPVFIFFFVGGLFRFLRRGPLVRRASS